MHYLIEFIVFVILLALLTPLLGSYLAKVFSGEPVFLERVIGPLEKLTYHLGGVNANEEMDWKEYGKHLLLFNTFGFVLLFLLLIGQQWLPLNPQNFPALPWDLAFNTASSFVTNTNLQSYAGETTLSYLSQTVGLTVQNFLSAATGMAVLLVLIRGLRKNENGKVGNFWFDLVRCLLYVLLPLSIIFSILFISQGVLQNLSTYVQISPLEGGVETIPMGPVASQVAIKQLGSNGGGFFNVNSAHPFENPTALSNFFQNLAILLIPAASVYMYGLMIGSKKHGVFLLIIMSLLWFGGMFFSILAERVFNPVIDTYPLLEGIETRFGIPNTILWSVSTTATSNGSVNGMLSSLPPLTGGVALFNIILGEIIFGGVGVGLCGMLMFTFLTVFLSGLMVGRSPEFMGKKIEKQEMIWVMCAVLIPGALMLIGTAVSTALPGVIASSDNQGPHGFTEILYAFTSAAGNNGSSFAGLNTNTLYYNLALGVVMLLGRCAIVAPSLAVAGSLARKKTIPTTPGSLSTASPLFAVLLIGVIFILGALTFFPALSVGPIVEHLLMLQNRSF